jgi:hypothetical protein
VCGPLGRWGVRASRPPPAKSAEQMLKDPDTVFYRSGPGSAVGVCSLFVSMYASALVAAVGTGSVQLQVVARVSDERTDSILIVMTVVGSLLLLGSCAFSPCLLRAKSGEGVSCGRFMRYFSLSMVRGMSFSMLLCLLCVNFSTCVLIGLIPFRHLFLCMLRLR